jgi:hypothetical protein
MKDFTDQLAKLIITNERSRMDKIMEQTMAEVSKDFEAAIIRYLDMYYDNYDPTSYVRVYGKKGKYMSGQMPKHKGQVSLHAAVSRKDGSLYSFSTPMHPNGYVSYIGGIEFDESNFKGNGMKHLTRTDKNGNARISEWDIVENFLYAGDGVGKGDWRSVAASGYDAQSPDELMGEFMGRYYSTFYAHFRKAIRKFS